MARRDDLSGHILRTLLHSRMLNFLLSFLFPYSTECPSNLNPTLVLR